MKATNKLHPMNFRPIILFACLCTSVIITANTQAGFKLAPHAIGMHANGMKDKEVVVMTYNVRLDTEGDGENAWPHRRDFLASQIAFHRPDVLGTQEGLPHQIAWLNERLVDYAYVGVGRQGGNEGEYSALFYNRRRYTVEDSGTFWLSETPDEVSKGWDAALPRICTWARLHDRTGGEDFFAFNTHFDHVGEEARNRAADLILHYADSLATDGLPYVVMGDLNLTPETEPIKRFDAQLTDAYKASPVRLGPEGTFTGWRPATERPEPRIDYVFVSPGVRVARYAALSDEILGRVASDHRSVVVALHLRPRPLIIAHRGASGHEVENSLLSFNRAVELGADMIEMDVFRLADGEIVVFHDDDLKRLTGAEGEITEQSWSSLSQLTIGNYERIPRFSEALALIDKRTRINVELKGPDTAEGTYKIIREFIEKHGYKLEDFQISSFRHEELRKIRGLDDRIEIAILPNGDPLEALAVAEEVGAAAINAHYKSITPEVLNKIRDAGLKVNVWTLRTRKSINKMKEMGVDGLITDYPDWARE